MNSKELASIIKWFSIAILAYLLVQFSIIMTLSYQQHETFTGEFSEPSPYSEPENRYEQSPNITFSVRHFLWHKVRLLFLSAFHSKFRKRELYNTWNSLSQDQYYKKMPYMVSKTKFPFVLTAETVCPGKKYAPKAVILIMSDWKSREQREAIRQTWVSGDYDCKYSNQEDIIQWIDNRTSKGEFIQFPGSEGKKNVLFWRNLVRHVFIFGLPSNEAERGKALQALKEENEEYGDIVVADFHDTYRNLSVKTLTGLRWASKYCWNVHFVIKTDHDVFIHVPRLYYLIIQPRYNDVISGRYTDGIGCDVLREGRYTIQYQAYPFDGGFPPHVKGGIYFMPLKIARAILEVGGHMPYVSVEDVYVTGILRQTAGAKAWEFPYDVYYELVWDLREEAMQYINGIRIASHAIKESMTNRWAKLLDLNGADNSTSLIYPDGHQEPSIWSLVHGHLTGMVNHAVNRASSQLTFRDGILTKLRARLNTMLDSSLKNIGYGPGPRNDTVRHEVEVAVDEALGGLNLTTPNSTFSKVLANTLDQEIELDAFGHIVNASSNSLDDTDFFHKMPLKDETLFVALICMAVILPIIFITLFGVFFYKRRQENSERRREMLLQDQPPEFSMSEYSSGDSPNRNEELIPDLDFRSMRA